MDGSRAVDGGADPSPVAAPPPHPAAPNNTLVDVYSFTHTPCYCEENIYMLCKELIRTGVAEPTGTDLYVVFISNEAKKVPLWHQKASNSDDGFICWDYHVICIQSRRNKGEVLDLVWDLDSDLPFPSPFIQYVSDAIRPLSFGDSIYRRFCEALNKDQLLRLRLAFLSRKEDTVSMRKNHISIEALYHRGLEGCLDY